MRKRKSAALAGAAIITVAALAVAATAAVQHVKEYAVGIAGGYQTKALISSGDTVPETSDPAKQYKVIGIPDGLGAHTNPDGTTTVYMNHELTSGTLSEPVVGDPLNRGALVSKLTLDEDGDVVSGERAYDWVYNENTFVGPRPPSATRPVRSHASARARWPAPSTGSTATSTSRTRKGGRRRTPSTRRAASPSRSPTTTSTRSRSSAVSPWENTLVQPNQGTRTVIMGLEDGPAAQDPAVENSQVYKYVGKKDRSAGAGVLRRNGLDNGEL